MTVAATENESSAATWFPGSPIKATSGSPPLFAIHQSPAAWFGKAILRLQRMAEVEENWDSYGAAGANAKSIKAAAFLLSSFSRINGVAEPIVTLSRDGNAAFVWETETASVEVEVLPDGQMRYVYLDPRNPAKVESGVSRDAISFLDPLTRL